MDDHASPADIENLNRLHARIVERLLDPADAGARDDARRMLESLLGWL